MTFIKNQFYMAIGIFSFCLLCGFMSPFFSSNKVSANPIILTGLSEIVFTVKQTNPTSMEANGSIEVMVSQGKAPYKAMLYSTNMPAKEYKFDKNLTVSNLKAGDYMIVVNDSDNAFKSLNIQLTNK